MKTNKLIKLILRGGLASLLFSSQNVSILNAEEESEAVAELLQPQPCAGHSINFNDVPVIEFIRFVSKISEENFIYDSRDLNFKISLSTGKAVSSEMVVQALIQLLKVHGLGVASESGYFVIHKSDEVPGSGNLPGHLSQKGMDGLLASNNVMLDVKDSERYEFFVYKLQYHEGPELEESLKKVAADLRNQPDAPIKLINAIQSLQWVKATNSLLFSADADTLQKLNKLVASLDIPLRQVFIEVLVIETDVKKSMEFGLQWAAGGQYNNRLGFGGGNFAPGSHAPGGFAHTMKGINATNTPTGLDQIPLVPGFDLGVIGDVIMHKGKSYFSLGSLVSALQIDGSSTIVLNQKIITQDDRTRQSSSETIFRSRVRL